MDHHLTPALQHFARSLDPVGRRRLHEALAFRVERILAFPAGPDRAREIHHLVDEAMEDFAREHPELACAVRCRRGCPHCCRIWVGITRDEAELLAEWVRTSRAVPDPGRLRIQRTWASPADFESHPREEAACIFLTAEGTCAVHPDRPSACRALLVASDPELCHEASRNTQITALINPEAELLVSAARSADAQETSRGGPLAARVAEALGLPPPPRYD